ncbi:MAG: aryl-sulfate sulfotransferase [Polyangiaceae bacterium]|nr:aryl-sulfate sulfotransferase [Polyangiaceae bacterium]
MIPTRASTFLLVQYFVLAGVSCSDAGTSSGSPSGGNSAATGGSSSYPGTGGLVGATGATTGAGGNATTGPTGGSAGTGGAWSTGGTSAAGTSSSGGSGPVGGSAPVGGGTNTVGGTSSRGGNSAVGGAQPSGGTSTTGGRSVGGRGGQSSGGTSADGGANPGGGTSSSGGSAPAGGTTSATGGSSGSTDCSFTVDKSVSSKMATVGIVQWSTTLSNPSSAQIVYMLDNAGADILNEGGTAPVDVTPANKRTLLLGLKPSSNYTFHIEATGPNGTCTSPDYTLTTGALSGAPSVTRTVSNASGLAKGFVVTSTGQGGGGMGGGSAYVIDADGTVVWYAAAPSQCSRALMDWEGANMWMLSLNVGNSNGEMRYLSMDGETGQNNVSGLSSAHHDFTVAPGGIVAAMVWASSGNDPESNLIERSPDGTLTTKFKIGSNLYVGGQSAMGGGTGSFHCNAIHYHQADDSYTIADRNPNLMVKATRTGSPVWQIGGNCSGAPAPKCAPGDWQVNHGHDFDKNGNLVFFNNGGGGGGMGGGGGSTHIFELKITDSGTFSTSVVKDFTSSNSSNVLGDVQRLPNGNTLITYSSAGVLLEVDASWATVQTLKGSFGYSNWRETLYGPPSRI